MKIYLARFEFGGYSECFVAAYPSKKSRKDKIKEVSAQHKDAPSGYHMDVEMVDLNVKPTKKDVIRFFNLHAYHYQ